MNLAQSLITDLYVRFIGRVPLRVGLTDRFGSVYPLVFEDESGFPIGLIGCAWNEGEATNQVQIYHISVFKPGQGHGSKILSFLCSQADRRGVVLTAVATELLTETEIGMDDLALDQWYRRFGFKGRPGCTLTREPRHAVIRF